MLGRIILLAAVMFTLAGAEGRAAVNQGPQFYRLDGMSRDEANAGNVRTFRGDGSPYLVVPGLTKVESVRVGNCEIPLEIEQKMPTDITLKEFSRVRVPLIYLAEAPDGTPVLLRSVQSNDGIWQDGQPIYVAGEWTDGGPRTEDRGPGTVSLAELDFNALKAEAIRRGLTVPVGTSTEGLRAMLLRELVPA